MDRIPTDKACIVSPNHVNAFLDALLVGAFAPTDMHYLSRASAFGSQWDWFLDALHMVPIYRRRDGYETLSRNWDIFRKERERLRERGALLMFSEAEHALTYHLRPLTRGSSRFALETRAAIDDEVLLVPVGINYYHLKRPGFKVSVVVGEPIPVSAYDEPYAEDEARCINQLRGDLTEGMKDCLLLPNKSAGHRRLAFINRKNEHLPFPEMKRALARLDAEGETETKTRLRRKDPYRPGLDRLGKWIDVLNAPPVWGMQRMMGWVQDPAFAASLKFATGMLVQVSWQDISLATRLFFEGLHLLRNRQRPAVNEHRGGRLTVDDFVAQGFHAEAVWAGHDERLVVNPAGNRPGRCAEAPRLSLNAHGDG